MNKTLSIKDLLLEKFKVEADAKSELAVALLDNMYKDKKIKKELYYFSLGLVYSGGYKEIEAFTAYIKSNIKAKEEK